MAAEHAAALFAFKLFGLMAKKVGLGQFELFVTLTHGDIVLREGEFGGAWGNAHFLPRRPPAGQWARVRPSLLSPAGWPMG